MCPRLRHLLMTSTALLALGTMPGGAQPTGGNVVGGTATISGAGTNSVIVNQSSDRAIINWNTFNIGTGGSATFHQPGASSITLNRVTGGLGPSVIDGTLTANGRVFIINRDGMLFGRNAVINTAGFLASTNDIRNDDFMAGRMNFDIRGRSDASIVNLGTITASNQGFAALVAPGVRNSGTISARLGTVALASGNSFTLDMYGDKLIQLAVGDEIANKVIDVATGKPLSALVSNEGTVSANGGRVEITAAAARHVVDSVINNTGVIEANSIGTRGGMIVLGGATASTKAAGLPKQTIKVSGKITATGKDSGAKGGTIQITGEDIQFAAAMLDVSGHAGGGKIMVGGDYGGGRPIPGGINNQSAVLEATAIATATTVTVDAASSFNASATANGHGGKVILWSDMATTFAGTVLARGGEQGGDGGFVEVSGKEQLSYVGHVDTRAPGGLTGTLLLDPNDINIDTDAAAAIVADLATTHVTVMTNAFGQGFGNITVNAPVTWSGGNSLTLSAYRNVIVNANITNDTGGADVILRADNTGTGFGTVFFFGNGRVSTAGNVSIFYNPVNYYHWATKSDAAGNPYAWFVTGGANLNAYMLVNSFWDLQAIATNLGGNYALGRNINAGYMAPIGSPWTPFTGTLEGDGRTISNAIISGWWQQTHIGLFSSIGIGGTVRNLTLTNFQVAANANPYLVAPNQFIGTLAGSNSGTISNVTVIGSTVNGLNATGVVAGGLVGWNGTWWPNIAATITNSTTSETVVNVGDGCAGDCYGGTNIAGGLVGTNFAGSTITLSSASGSVTGGAYSVVGGLVGENSGTITSTTTPNALTSNCAIGASFSCATGNVSVGMMGSGGGLVGSNNGTIEKSFAIGNVTGDSGLGDSEAATRLGGLAGSNRGEISDSFARGTVGSIASNFIVAGGLVGDNSGTILNSKASGNVLAGTFSLAGGLVGAHFSDTRSASLGDGFGLSSEGSSALIKNSSASGTVSVGNAGYGGGLVGATNGTIENSFASGAILGHGTALLGGLAGANAGDITGSYATGAVTAAQGNAGGFVGLNLGRIQLSSAKGNVSSSGFAMLGGFVGLNAGEINQAYAIGAVSGAPGGYLGGFVGLNLNAEITFGDAGFGSDALNGRISQSYALGSVTGSNALVAGAFAALNFGSLDQVYGVGHVQGATTRGGLVGANSGMATVPDWGSPHTINGPTGTATNSYWDMQTTAVTTSAGGTGMNTAVLAGGLPPGFESGIWDSHSYPFLVALNNPPLPEQDTTPLPPVIPPVGDNQQFLPPPDQQINPNQFNTPQSNDPLPDTTQFVQQQQQRQQQQQQADQTTTGSINDPIRLDVGENRYFYLPPPGETRLATNEVVLQLPCDVPTATLNEILKQHNLSVLGSQCLQEGGNAAYRMQHASGETIASVIRALAAHQVIAAAQANYLYAMQETSVQSATSQQGDPGQYVPEKLRLLAAHRVVTGAGVPIGVIDSEIDVAHPDYRGAVAGRYDATGVEDNPHPHGTGMAGAIVSRQRLLGVAPGARILAIRAFSTRASNTESTTYHILKGLDWAVSNNVRIVNMSFAGPRDPSLERALKAAYDKGIVLIAAAGNAGPRAPALFPAADPNVIAVTATDVNDRLFTGANRGNHVAIAAPGVDILVPAPAGEYQVTTGTSVATAHISGVVALMLERNPKLTPAEVRRILAASAKRLGPTNQFGAGLVNPIRAIEMATPRSAAAPRPLTPRPATTVAARP